MCSYYFHELVLGQKSLDHIWTKLNYVPSAMRVSDQILVYSYLSIILSGIWPQNINHEFLNGCLHLMNYLQRSLYLIDLIQSLKWGPNASVNADNLIINNCDQGHVLEHSIYCVEHWWRVFGLVLQSLLTFI